MAESTSLARPYARAAFEAARDTGQFDDWSQSLNLLAAITSDDRMASVLRHPGLSAQEKIQLISDVCENPLPEPVSNFIQIMAENRRLAQFPAVAALFEAYRHDHERIVDVTLTTAFELSDDQKQRLSQALEKRLDRSVELSVESDQSIIGGVVIRAGDEVIDASLRGRLNRLANAMGA
ncbi:F0F1 ATP synthase subunit delta [Halovibrio salipaludis]|uniref:ATP synthase subunit delta n=1 Tax=Halovibrio salipaludis TaxID=2032626 RepID=A0A2A2FAS0_9GAMM|nr:F0F1 ATP synthase subunit delta [Halovibrio salipaludis]PAU82048.1 F0F1 ATP synthase subunit delta [Halovibrio salipaludis]